MTPAVTPTKDTGATEKLCGLLLDAIGRSAVRMDTARRHVAILDAAIPHMTLAQRADARHRIDRLETRWGPMLPGFDVSQEKQELDPEIRLCLWLSTRRSLERLLKVIHRTAISISEGATKLYDMMDYAYAPETDLVLSPVGYDTFKEWVIELRLARKVGRGEYEEGELCQWLIDQIVPSGDRRSPYRALLDRLADEGRFRAARGEHDRRTPVSVEP